MTERSYHFIAQRPHCNFGGDAAGCSIYGPETPVPDDVEVHMRIAYDARMAPWELASNLRLLADHIADDLEFHAADARRALTDPKFGTGVYHPACERRMRMISEVYPANGKEFCETRIDELKASLEDLKQVAFLCWVATAYQRREAAAKHHDNH